MEHDAHDRRSFLDAAGRVGGGAAAAALLHAVTPGAALGQRPAATAHPASARLVDRLRSRMTYQFSVDVNTIDLGLSVAAAALAGGVDIIEMGTPLLKTQGVANVVPAFRKRFPDALLLADMKTMDGGGTEARGVYAGGGNVIDFLALAGVETAKAVCAVRDEFRRDGPDLPRLAFSDIMLTQRTPIAQVGEIALRMVDAGIDAVGVHLQTDARRADPTLIASDYLGDMARAVFERIGRTVPVQVVGGLYVAQAQRLARAGLRGFVISGNMGLPDGQARYNLPPAEIQGLVQRFIAEVSKA